MLSDSHKCSYRVCSNEHVVHQLLRGLFVHQTGSSVIRACPQQVLKRKQNPPQP